MTHKVIRHLDGCKRIVLIDAAEPFAAVILFRGTQTECNQFISK